MRVVLINDDALLEQLREGPAAERLREVGITVAHAKGIIKTETVLPGEETRPRMEIADPRERREVIIADGQAAASEALKALLAKIEYQDVIDTWPGETFMIHAQPEVPKLAMIQKPIVPKGVPKDWKKLPHKGRNARKQQFHMRPPRRGQR